MAYMNYRGAVVRREARDAQKVAKDVEGYDDTPYARRYQMIMAALDEYMASQPRRVFEFFLYLETFLGPYTGMLWFRLLTAGQFIAMSGLSPAAGYKRANEVVDACKKNDFQGAAYTDPARAVANRFRILGSRRCAQPYIPRVANRRRECPIVRPHKSHTCVVCAPVEARDYQQGRFGGYDPPFDRRELGIREGWGAGCDGAVDQIVVRGGDAKKRWAQYARIRAGSGGRPDGKAQVGGGTGRRLGAKGK